jgi:malonyl-CoA O-methyltransferase
LALPATFDLDPIRVDASIATVRRQFDARAARFGEHDAVVREVSKRMLERMALMRHDVRRVLDLGCGAGASRTELQRRFPAANYLGVDVSPAMLAGATGKRGWIRHAIQWLRAGHGGASRFLCASAERLPLPDSSVDLVFSNLALHWHPAPHEAVREIARVLRTGGLLMLSSYGPDTWKELREACEEALPHVAPMPFVDMHDIGDMMVEAGFEAPVMEVEHMNLTFGDARALLAEARLLGGNPREDRAKGLPSGRAARAFLAKLEQGKDVQGRLPLHFEIVVGHGWKAKPRIAGEQMIAMPSPYRTR